MKNQRNKRMYYSICAIILSVVMVLLDVGTVNKYVFASTVTERSNGYELVDKIQDASILHCWNWSYKTIEENMQLIAESGYSAIQTSPATQPKDYTYKGVVGTEVGIPGYGGTGNWWKLYQPVTQSVCDNGQTWLGTKEELESMCQTAEKYGIKVIVDIVANHMGNITGWKNSLSDVSPQIGEYWNSEMLTDASYWHINSYQVWMSDSRLHFTMGSLGMPDLNTADKRVQAYISNYLKELIDCGADGFRFDAAKHIETPDDDPSFASDFWPTVLGEARSHYKAKTGGELYVYGEILNTVGDNFSINSYTKYMSVTDNSAGNHLLEAFRNNNVNTLNMNYAPNVSVLWAESHDTYMNESSRYASDKSIVRTWAMVANKDNAAKLFFVRPYYSVNILEGDVDGAMKGNLKASLTPATMGACETYTWASKEVAAINHFNNRMVDKQENMGTEGNIAYCFRGDGVALVNFSGSGQISMSARGMANGTYTDEVSGNTFTVANGVLSGRINSEYGIAVVYKNVMPNPSSSYPVQIHASVGNGTSFYGDSLSVIIEALYADSATYSASTGEYGSFTGSKTIDIGKGLSSGDTVTLTVTGTNARGTVTQIYTYTKKEYDLENCIFFKNTSGWSTVTAYVWNDKVSPVKNNAAWPGEEMFKCDSLNNIYALKINPDAGYTKIIFSNNGASQTKDQTMGSIGYMYNMSTGTWEPYKEVGDKTPTIVASKESSVIAAAIDVTFSVTDAQSATYSINGGNPVSFQNAVTVRVGDNLAEGAMDTVVINAQNGTKTKISTYQYTMNYTPPVVTASIPNGTTFTDALNVEFTVSDGSTATILYGTTSTAFNGSIRVTATDTTTYTIVVTKGGKNYTFTYTYTKNENDLENCIFFKNTSGWSTVTAYVWNDKVSPVKNNASWPGQEMFKCDSQNGIYALKINPDAGYTKIIFSNKGASQTKDLAIGNIGYLYNMNTGTWELYKEVGDKTPTIAASKESSVITAAMDVTFSVKDAQSSTYTINGGNPVSFQDSVTVRVGINLAEGAMDTVVINAQNGTKTKSSTYQYTMEYKEPVVTASVSSGTTFTDSLDVTFTVTNALTATISNGTTTTSFENSIRVAATDTTTYTIVVTKGGKTFSFTYTYTKLKEVQNSVYLNVSACSWFGNDSAVAVVKFNNESGYTKCEKLTYNNSVYYKAMVPVGATSVTIGRMIPNGNIYNTLTISLLSEKNVWTSNSSFNGGNWTYSSAIGTTLAN